jgi:hypothetical protein
MFTAASRELTRTTAAEIRSSRPAVPPRAVNSVWTGLALGGVVQRKCAECASGGSCPACEEGEQAGGA